MEGTALGHKLSDAVRIRLDNDGIFPVVEIEFNFVRYRLTIDNTEKAEKLILMIEQALMKREGGTLEDVKLPRFYRGSEQP